MFITAHFWLTKTSNIFKVPKKVPEEKVPVPVEKKEAPPAKGIFPHLSQASSFIFSKSVRFCLCVLVGFDVFCL